MHKSDSFLWWYEEPYKINIWKYNINIFFFHFPCILFVWFFTSHALKKCSKTKCLLMIIICSSLQVLNNTYYVFVKKKNSVNMHYSLHLKCTYNKKVRGRRKTLKPLNINWNPHIRQKNKREVGREVITKKKK